MEFKGTKGERFVMDDAKGVSVFSKRNLIFRTENKPTKEEAWANAKLACKSLEMLEHLEEVSKFLYDFKFKDKDQAYELQSRTLRLIKDATELK